MAQPTQSERTHLSRRTMVRAAGAGLAIAAAPARTNGHGDTGRIRPYPSAELRKDVIDLAYVQYSARPVDPLDVKRGLAANLKRMVTLIDEHAHWTGPADLLAFTGFPVTGSASLPGEGLRNAAIDLPGDETFVLSAKAQEYSLWLAFTCYGRDPVSPDHANALGVLINPHGEIVARQGPSRRQVALTDVGNINLTPFRDTSAASAAAGEGCEISLGGSQNAGIPFAVDVTRTGTGITGPGGVTLAKSWGTREEIVRAALPLGRHRAGYG